jgi:hypothetical protein
MAIFLPLKFGPAIRQLPRQLCYPTASDSFRQLHDSSSNSCVRGCRDNTTDSVALKNFHAQTACVKNFHRGRRDEFVVAMNALDKLRQTNS